MPIPFLVGIAVAGFGAKKVYDNYKIKAKEKEAAEQVEAENLFSHVTSEETLQISRALQEHLTDPTFFYFCHVSGKDRVKIARAIRAYAELVEGEEPVASFDATLFGAAEEGVVLTTKRMIYSVGFESGEVRYEKAEQPQVVKYVEATKELGCKINPWTGKASPTLKDGTRAEYWLVVKEDGKKKKKLQEDLSIGKKVLENLCEAIRYFQNKS